MWYVLIWRAVIVLTVSVIVFAILGGWMSQREALALGSFELSVFLASFWWIVSLAAIATGHWVAVILIFLNHSQPWWKRSLWALAALWLIAPLVVIYWYCYVERPHRSSLSVPR
jgi:hypothetical protein